MTAAPIRKIPVGVLGATGAVGQTFIKLLANHPWFEVTAVAASERSAGKRYSDAAHWLSGDMPERVAKLTVTACDPAVVDAPVVFSALDSDAAEEVEAAFARAGRLVLSNARNYRMDADVPIGSAVDFTISLPADVVGAEVDVQVDCRGRVVRSFEDGGRRGVGVVIDEYRFERR